MSSFIDITEKGPLLSAASLRFQGEYDPNFQAYTLDEAYLDAGPLLLAYL